MFEGLRDKRIKWFEAMIISIFAVSLAGLGAEFGDGKWCFFGLILLVPSLLYLLIRMPRSPKLLALIVVAWILCGFMPVVMFSLSITMGVAYVVIVLLKGTMEWKVE